MDCSACIRSLLHSKLRLRDDDDNELASKAVRGVLDEMMDVLLFSGAARLVDNGSVVIDWDEAECRALLKKACESEANGP